MKRIISAIIAAALAFSLLPAAILAAPETVSSTVSGYVSGTRGDIEIASKTKSPNIYVDGENDYPGVARAANDLKDDIKAVTGVEANIVSDASNADIIIGTIGKSAAVDLLVESGAVDISEIEGEWEAFTLRNVNGKLVIAGADKRGTIYGIYDLTEKMGVSPWEWWADVAPRHSDALYVSLPDSGYTEGAPSVKYRGIFINQEWNLYNWSQALASESETNKGMNEETYKRIFELLLRLKANYLWPAMHEYSPAFNNNPNNAKNADEYGIIMASSHCEMLLRNNMGELLDFQKKWIEANPGKKLYMFKDSSLNADVAYDYTDVDKEGNPVCNKEFIEDYWRERVRANRDYESNFTIGMRGVHDGAWNPVNAKTDEEKIALLEEIIAKQREILSEEIGKSANEIPQTFIPYKEILPLYNKGLNIPDDVTIMWTNDNYGHIRQGANETERQRAGGGGMYYHVSYFGRPSSVIWNGGSQLGLIKEEMTKAYDTGADTIWVLNVGPLKPFENQTEYFLDLGRNIDKLRDMPVKDYVADNAKRYFGFTDAQAAEYADIQCEFLETANSRRPEFQVQGIYSLTDYGDEGQKTVDKYADLLKRSTALYNALPEALKPAFYELQLYAVRCAYDVITNYVYADKSVLYKAQKRGADVNKYAAKSAAGRAAIDTDTSEYNSMLGGKWDKLINPFQTVEHGSWDIKIGAAEAESISELSFTEMGIAVENRSDITDSPKLDFSGYTKDVRFIDIFNQGTGSFDWKITADKDWIIFNKSQGTVFDDDRIYVGINWDKAPDGSSTAKITVTRYIGENAVQSKTIDVEVNNDIKDLPEKTYAEANGYASIEAEHYSRNVARGGDTSGEGVVTGSAPRLITEADGNTGIIAVYKDGALKSVYTSTDYSDGAYAFSEPINPVSGETVKGMVWSSLDDMNPMGEAYGLAQSSNTKYEWVEQDDFGRSGNSMKFTPDTAESISDNSAYLEYDVYFESTGTFVADVYRMPTLNERGSVNFALGSDDNAPTILKGCNAYYNNSTGTDKWGKGILNNIEILTANITIDEPGIHKIRLYGVDPGAVVDKIVITTGEKYDSFYGAPESYNTTYNNQPMIMPEATDVAKEITGDIQPLFEAKLVTAGVNTENGALTGTDVIKLADVSTAYVTAAVYDNGGKMLASETTEYDFSVNDVNEKITVPLALSVPSDASEMQIIIYDGKDTLNALAPAYAVSMDGISLAASYDNGTVSTKSSLDGYIGKEAICMITPEGSDTIVYIRQETVGEETFKTINAGELDGSYNVNIGVAPDSAVVSEKVRTAKNVEPDNPETSSELYKWDFADVGDLSAPVTVSGNAVYDETNGAIKMTSTDKSGGKLNVDFTEPVKTVQGQRIIVESKIAYGRQDGKYMDYVICDSLGNELVKSHICAFSSSKTQSIQIGGAECNESGLPDGIKTSNKNNDGIQNGYSTYTAVLDPDTNTITLTVSNSEGSSTFTGKFPQNTSFDLGSLAYSTTHAYKGRSCYADDISVMKTTAPSFNISFDIKDADSNAVDGASINITDAKYGVSILPEADGTYKLCDGIYSYTIAAAGYADVAADVEVSQAMDSKTISVTMEKSE